MNHKRFQEKMLMAAAQGYLSYQDVQESDYGPKLRFRLGEFTALSIVWSSAQRTIIHPGATLRVSVFNGENYFGLTWSQGNMESGSDTTCFADLKVFHVEPRYIPYTPEKNLIEALKGQSFMDDVALWKPQSMNRESVSAKGDVDGPHSTGKAPLAHGIT